MAVKSYDALVAALGGIDNVLAANGATGTLIVSVKDFDLVDMKADGVDLAMRNAAIEAKPSGGEAQVWAIMINQQVQGDL